MYLEFASNFVQCILVASSRNISDLKASCHNNLYSLALYKDVDQENKNSKGVFTL